jgi:hypothetical protein
MSRTLVSIHQAFAHVENDSTDHDRHPTTASLPGRSHPAWRISGIRITGKVLEGVTGIYNRVPGLANRDSTRRESSRLG